MQPNALLIWHNFIVVTSGCYISRVAFKEFIDNEKIRGKWWGDDDVCTFCMSNYYLCDFLEIIDNEKIRGK
jgi:hypothetical protein